MTLRPPTPDIGLVGAPKNQRALIASRTEHLEHEKPFEPDQTGRMQNEQSSDPDQRESIWGSPNSSYRLPPHYRREVDVVRFGRGYKVYHRWVDSNTQPLLGFVSLPSGVQAPMYTKVMEWIARFFPVSSALRRMTPSVMEPHREHAHLQVQQPLSTHHSRSSYVRGVCKAKLVARRRNRFGNNGNHVSLIHLRSPGP